MSELPIHVCLSTSPPACALQCSVHDGHHLLQESLTPKERQSAHEVNSLGLPVRIHLEDHLIPLPQSYSAAGAGGGADELAEGSTLWRTDTDGDLARWLNNGFTPRAGGGLAIEVMLSDRHQHAVLQHMRCISTVYHHWNGVTPC